MVDPHDDPIALVPSEFDRWREAYERERERLRTLLREHGLSDRVERIEHVGSTAVPDLPAKDVVDLDLVVADGSVRAVSRAIETDLGGTRIENGEGWHPVFRRHGDQRFNDHVFAASDPVWRVSVATRDVLRARPQLRSEYAEVKRGLAGEHDELEAYSVGQTAFVGEVLAVAREDDGIELGFEVPEL